MTLSDAPRNTRVHKISQSLENNFSETFLMFLEKQESTSLNNYCRQNFKSINV